MNSLRVPSIFSRGLAILFALALSLGFASAAQAHSVLLDTDPDDGTQLEIAPESVSLTFNEDITSLGTEVVITVGDEELVVSEGAIEVTGPKITQALAAERPEGLYTVTWRAVSADGHPISGVFNFTAAQATGATPAEPEATEEPEAPEATPEESPEQSESPSEEGAAEGADTDAADDAGESSGLSASTWVIIAILIAAALILITMIGRALASSRRSQ